MSHIAIVGPGKAPEPPANALLGVTPQWRFRKGNKRLNQLLDVGVSGDVQAATTVVSCRRPQGYYDQPDRSAAALHGMETEDYPAALVRRGNDAPGTPTPTPAARPDGPGRICAIGAQGTARLESGSSRENVPDEREEVLVNERGSGSGANVMAFSHEVWSDILAAMEVRRDSAITGEATLGTQRLIEANPEKGGT